MKDNFIGAYQLDCLSVYFRVRTASLCEVRSFYQGLILTLSRVRSRTTSYTASGSLFTTL